MMEIPEVGVDALGGLLDDGAVLFDVRQPDEFAEVRVPGAVLVPLGEVPDRIAEFSDRGTVYVICRSGNRSGQAVGFLRGRGIDAINVAGGTMAWVESGAPTDTGEPGE
jgi:rhodanese-related sulfurtransferase